MTERENRAAGCIFGGAAGDALGYPVEFMEADTIFFRYGDRGITRYATANGKALISDDTQMTLFTADGLFAAERRYRCPTAAQYIGCIHESYLNWLVTQDKTFRLPEGGAPRTARPGGRARAFRSAVSCGSGRLNGHSAMEI